MNYIEIIKRFNISHFIDRHFPACKISGDERIIVCPKCGSKDKEKCWINIKKKKVHCWICEWTPSIDNFVAEVLNCSRVKALIFMESNLIDDYKSLDDFILEFNKYRNEDVFKLEQFKPVLLPKEYVRLSRKKYLDDSMGSIGKLAYRYLKNRGVSWKDILINRVGYCYDGYYQMRIIIPVLNDRGDVIYFTAVSINNKVFPKSLQPKNKGGYISKDKVIWNLNGIKRGGSLTLCEGFFDAVVTLNGVALLGKVLSPYQVKLIYEKQPSEIIIALDGDAIIQIHPLVKSIFGFCRSIKIVILPDGKDPNDLQGRFERVVPFDDFIVGKEKIRRILKEI